MSKRIMQKVGTYKAKDGQEKGNYMQVGTMVPTKYGESILLNMAPNFKINKDGYKECWLLIFEDKPKSQQTQQAPPRFNNNQQTPQIPPYNANNTGEGTPF